MAVRNFWISAEVDGRRTRLEGGPLNKDGGFELTVYIRDEGSIVHALDITGRAHNGHLRLIASQPKVDGNEIVVETER